jgi:hypothetical protein
MSNQIMLNLESEEKASLKKEAQERGLSVCNLIRNKLGFDFKYAGRPIHLGEGEAFQEAFGKKRKDIK